MNNILMESRGFAARKPGDQFVDPTNPQDIATFLGITTLPQDADSYENKDELVNAYQEWQTTQSNTSIYPLNKPTALSKAAMIINMDTPRGLESFVYFTRDNASLANKLTSIPPGIVVGQGGYILNRATSKSERAGVKPSDVLTGNPVLSPNKIPAALDAARETAGDEVIDQMQAYLKALLAGKGQGYIIQGGAKYASIHQKYLGEWAAPIALITSQVDPDSQIPELEQYMLGGDSIRKCKVQFNTSVSALLIDSVVTTGTNEIGISSKAHGGGGAAASLKGLYNTIHEHASEFPPKFWQNRKNQEFRQVIETINDKTAIEGILELAVKTDLISLQDKISIADMIKDPKKGRLSSAVVGMMTDYAANENHPLYNRGKHALASVAKALCNKLNAENYTETATAILSKSSMVQMNFVTTIKGEDLICKDFKLIWPPKFAGRVNFYSGKAFSATEIKDKLGFKISATKQVDEPDESLKAPSLSKVEVEKKKKEAERAVGKITAPGSRDKRDPKVKDVVALGREMKKR